MSDHVGVEIEQLSNGHLKIKGTDKEFELSPFLFMVEVSELQAGASLDARGNKWFFGTCFLTEHEKIGVIGRDELTTNKLSFSVSPLNIPDMKDDPGVGLILKMAEGKTVEYDSDPTVILTFNQREVDYGRDEHFFLDVRVSEKIFASLLSHVIRRDLKALRFGFRARNLYSSTSDHFAPEFGHMKWLLAPDLEDSKRRPHPGYGDLCSLSVTSIKLKLEAENAADEIEQAEIAEDRPLSIDIPAEHTSPTEENRVRALIAIARCLRILPWIIGGAALLIALT